MTALEVAQSAGLALRQKGARYWACCPMHGEKTASLCFFPDGRWYCFGCHAHGDGADLYAALHGVSMGEALRVVRGEGPRKAAAQPTRQQQATLLRRRVEEWQAGRWTEACQQRHRAQQTMAALEAVHSAETLMESEKYWNAIAQKAAAEDELNLLESATPAQLIRMASEEKQKDEL